MFKKAQMGCFVFKTKVSIKFNFICLLNFVHNIEGVLKEKNDSFFDISKVFDSNFTLYM